MKRRLAETGKRTLLGLAIQRYDTTFIEIAGLLGFDAIWIEMEHEAISIEQAGDMCRVASGVGLLTMLRVPDPTRASVLKAAELGPDILDLPMVNAPSTAEEFVRHARFPPLGERGFFGSSRAVRYGIGDPVPDQQQRLNDDLCLLIQVETKAAVGCAADLCRVHGVDGIFLGPGDLSVSFGVPGQAGHPEVRAAMEETVKIAHQSGVLASGACAPSDFAYWADRGAELLFCAGNISCQISGARLVLDEIGDARMASSKPRLVG